MRLEGLVLILLALPAQAQASEALWALLKSGGQVVIMRHAATDSTAGDRDTMRLEDCSTQRNLSPAGRDEARRIGSAFKARGITVDDVRSSVWCRCHDTATLAFGMANPWLPLNSFFRNRDREPGQTGAVRNLVSRHRGGTLILVTHQVNITALTGLYPAEGEMIVLTPQGGDFTVAGRVKASDVTANQGGG
jgi:broad specificity phosphatase PhoE